MKAIEINTCTDQFGHLKLDYAIANQQRNVRVILLLEEINDEMNEEKLWIQSISSNPAFDFLKDDCENIYSLTDGKPFKN